MNYGEKFILYKKSFKQTNLIISINKQHTI
jgi:hypothetical protein